MSTRQPPRRGPRLHRFLVQVLTVALGILIYWLLGFVVDDIGTWPGPDYTKLEQSMLDQELVRQSQNLGSQIVETERHMTDERARQAILQDSTASSQTTMNQLLEMQRLALQKNHSLSVEEQKALAESERLFLENQSQYQKLNDEVARLNDNLRSLREEARRLDKVLDEKREPIRRVYEAQLRRHELALGALKLGALTPLLVAAVYLFLRRRSGLYAPLVYAFGIALAAKVALVMHEYFPTRYFKYVLILTCLAVVVRALVTLLKLMAAPRSDWLLRQYREAYESFCCPVCDYPIRRGPLRYLSWNRRTARRLQLPPGGHSAVEEPYTCPMCATRLYEECEACRSMRPALLPACDHCGAVRPDAPAVA